MADSDSRGKFVWYELLTSDPAAAQDFYIDVVGWGTAPFEGAPIPYTMWMKGETPVGGVVEFPQEEAKGQPPHWMAHVYVDDVDATAARVTELGGEILMGPEDIPDVGRYAVFRDPQGAVLSAFRPTEDMDRSEGEPEPGDVSWNELGTTDQGAALAFYSDLFGWEKQEAMPMGEAGVYQMYGRAGRMLGGMYNKTADMPDVDKGKSEPGPPAWLYYIRVPDLDESVQKVRAKGGKIVVEPMEVPGGSRIAVGIDPQGAAFGLHGWPE